MAIIIISYSILLFVSIIAFIYKVQENKKIKESLKKNEFIINEFQEWIYRFSENYGIEKQLLDKGFYTVAIYGMGRVGECLKYYLEKSGILVMYGIDSNPDYVFSDIEIYRVTDILPVVDAIIITPAYAYQEISEKLKPIVSCEVISVDDLIFENKI